MLAVKIWKGFLSFWRNLVFLSCWEFLLWKWVDFSQRFDCCVFFFTFLVIFAWFPIFVCQCGELYWLIFLNVKPTLHYRDKLQVVIMYYSLYVLLDLICYLVKDFCSYDHEIYWSANFLQCVCLYKDNSGLIILIRKYPLSVNFLKEFV